MELCIHPQRVERDDNMAVKEFGELAKVRRRGHVIVGDVNILTHFLSLTKVEEIRMVNNGTYTVMNTSLWVPHFARPVVGSILRAEEKGKFMAD